MFLRWLSHSGRRRKVPWSLDEKNLLRPCTSAEKEPLALGRWCVAVKHPLEHFISQTILQVML